MLLTFVFCKFINSRFISFNKNTGYLSIEKNAVSLKKIYSKFGLMATVF